MADYTELIKALRCCADDDVPCCEDCPNVKLCIIDYHDTMMHMMVKAADAIEELMPRWIPVTERLPLKGDDVLCFGDNGISIADFVASDKWCVLPWFYVDGEQETGVTHWMPLPQPPKEET